MLTVCHISSAHESTDVRIFIKECTALADSGYETHMVAKGASRVERGVHVVGIGEAPSSRMKRMLFFAKLAYTKALELNCQVYHIHDPELLPFAVRLKKKGKVVFFDSHEDVPSQIMDKTWIPLCLRKIVSKIYSGFESYVVKKLDGVVAATPYIGEKFLPKNRNVVVVRNYPSVRNVKAPIPFSERKLEMGYTGIRVTKDRGAIEMVEAANKAKVRLDIYGNMGTEELHQEILSMNEEGYTVLHGKVPYDQLQEDMSNLKIGLLVEHATPNAVNALCIKMFEYMLHGIAIISSNIPLWREVIENAECGICVDPQNVDTIVETVKYLQSNPEICEKLGRNGYYAVQNHYSWEKEKDKLIQLYEMFNHE